MIAGLVVPPYLEMQRAESIYQLEKEVTEVNRQHVYQMAQIYNNDSEMKVSHERRVELLKLASAEMDKFGRQNSAYLKEQTEKRNAIYDSRLTYLYACMP